MSYNLQELVKQWDWLSNTAVKSGQAYAEIDSLQWFNYLAFDIIGDLVRIPACGPTASRSRPFSHSEVGKAVVEGDGVANQAKVH